MSVNLKEKLREETRNQLDYILEPQSDDVQELTYKTITRDILEGLTLDDPEDRNAVRVKNFEFKLGPPTSSITFNGTKYTYKTFAYEVPFSLYQEAEGSAQKVIETHIKTLASVSARVMNIQSNEVPVDHILALRSFPEYRLDYRRSIYFKGDITENQLNNRFQEFDFSELNDMHLCIRFRAMWLPKEYFDEVQEEEKK